MRIERSDAGFQDWLRFLFDHPETSVEKPWFNGSYEPWDGKPETFLAYVTALFDDCGRLLASYPDIQVAHGLDYVSTPGVSDDMQDLVLAQASADDYAECIRAMLKLYTELWAKRCAPALSGGEEKTGPLNAVCYMWWDRLALGVNRQVDLWKAAQQPSLEVMERALEIPHLACRESALHGLGHWQHEFPDQVKAIVDRFLARGGVPERLKTYAMRARLGQIQ